MGVPGGAGRPGTRGVLRGGLGTGQVGGYGVTSGAQGRSGAGLRGKGRRGGCARRAGSGFARAPSPAGLRPAHPAGLRPARPPARTGPRAASRPRALPLPRGRPRCRRRERSGARAPAAAHGAARCLPAPGAGAGRRRGRRGRAALHRLADLFQPQRHLPRLGRLVGAGDARDGRAAELPAPRGRAGLQAGAGAGAGRSREEQRPALHLQQESQGEHGAHGGLQICPAAHGEAEDRAAGGGWQPEPALLLAALPEPGPRAGVRGGLGGQVAPCHGTPGAARASGRGPTAAPGRAGQQAGQERCPHRGGAARRAGPAHAQRPAGLLPPAHQRDPGRPQHRHQRPARQEPAAHPALPALSAWSARSDSDPGRALLSKTMVQGQRRWDGSSRVLCCAVSSLLAPLPVCCTLWDLGWS